MSRSDFEDAVRDALDEIPGELAAHMSNVVVLVEDDGTPMERVFTAIIPTDEPITVNAIQVSLSPGVASVNDEPAIVLGPAATGILTAMVAVPLASATTTLRANIICPTSSCWRPPTVARLR